MSYFGIFIIILTKSIRILTLKYPPGTMDMHPSIGKVPMNIGAFGHTKKTPRIPT